MTQKINGRFTLKLAGIPLILGLAKLYCTADSGSRAGGTGIIIGPGLMIAWVGPQFKQGAEVPES